MLAPTSVEHDPLWVEIRGAAQAMASNEPALASLVYACVLNQARFEDALTYLLAQQLETEQVPAMLLRQVFDAVLSVDAGLGEAARADLMAVYDRDPACKSPLEAFLFFKGYQAVQSYRYAHRLLATGRRALALFIESRAALIYAIDINPAAKLGSGIMIDHGTGVVIGETAVVEDNVSLLQGVTLGGTGKVEGDRHPKIRAGATVGASATILGNIEVGAGAKIGAGSVVLRSVPGGCTATGVPARLVGRCAEHVLHEQDR